MHTERARNTVPCTDSSRFAPPCFDTPRFHSVFNSVFNSVFSPSKEVVVSYAWATESEIIRMQQQSESARPVLLLEGQSISPMWESPDEEMFASHAHPLIQGTVSLLPTTTTTTRRWRRRFTAPTPPERIVSHKHA